MKKVSEKSGSLVSSGVKLMNRSTLTKKEPNNSGDEDLNK